MSKQIKAAFSEFGAYLGWAVEQLAQGMAAVSMQQDAAERTAEAVAEIRDEIRELKDLVSALTAKTVELYGKVSDTDERLNLYLQDATQAEATARKNQSDVQAVDKRLRLVEAVVSGGER